MLQSSSNLLRQRLQNPVLRLIASFSSSNAIQNDPYKFRPQTDSKVFDNRGELKEFKPMDIQAKMDKIFNGAEAEKEKKAMNVHSDGPMGVGILGQDALAKSTFEYNTESPLKGVIFDLATLLNTTPSDSGDAALEGNIVSDSHWNIGFGAREALLYLNARGIKTALLPRILIDNKQLIDGTIDVFEERMNYEFSYHAENAAQLKQVDQHLKDICLQMGLKEQDVMCLSMSEQVITAAKQQGMYTCAMSLGGKNWKTTQLAKNKIVRLEELQSHVEELNGISYRL